MRLKWFAFAETWNYSDCCIKAGTHQVLLWTLPWVLTVRYPSSGTNLLKLCLPTDIHLSPAILLQEAFWSVKHPVELPQDLLQPGCNWVASFLLRLFVFPRTIHDYSKPETFRISTEVGFLFVDQNLTGLESLLHPFQFHIIVLFIFLFLGSFWWNLQEAQGGSRFGGAIQQMSQVEGKGHLGLNEVLWQERHAQEDAKRRKLREDLEGQTLGFGVWHIKEDTVLGW